MDCNSISKYEEELKIFKSVVGKNKVIKGYGDNYYTPNIPKSLLFNMGVSRGRLRKYVNENKKTYNFWSGEEK